MSHAGSWREFPDGRGGFWRCPWLAPARKRLDHDHAAAAARAWGMDVIATVLLGLLGDRNREQAPSLGEVVLAG